MTGEIAEGGSVSGASSICSDRLALRADLGMSRRPAAGPGVRGDARLEAERCRRRERRGVADSGVEGTSGEGLGLEGVDLGLGFRGVASIAAAVVDEIARESESACLLGLCFGGQKVRGEEVSKHREREKRGFRRSRFP